MLKSLAALFALSLALAPSARAAGVNLAWDNCAGAGGAHDMTFACDTNVGSHTFVASFVAPSGITKYVSNEGTVELLADASTLPTWWQIKGSTQCRNGAATGDANFASGPFGCTDLWSGAASGAFASYNVGYLAPNRSRFNLVFAVPAALAQPLNEGQEYYAFKVTIQNTRTIGTGSCAGCSIGACLACTRINVVQPNGTPGGNVTLVSPARSNLVLWNQVPYSLCTGTDGGWVPARGTTWGQIKSLYR